MGKEMERKAAKSKPREPQECPPQHTNEVHLIEEENGEGEQNRDVENLCPNDDEGEEQQDEERRQHEKQELLRMSLNTAIAIALHNFPEGLATFLSTLADPSVGFVLAVAISIHNIPEGLCVAMPVYYATGSRWKALGWALLSGLSEPFAALLGWVVLAGAFSDALYAVMFGLVAGMMVIISVRELLPTAHKYDPEDSVVTYFFILGMVIMALSLLLFAI
jgi:zinc transporter, ZIP family